MKLAWWQRLVVGLAASGLLGCGVLGSVRNWAAAGIVPMLLAGLVLGICALVGSIPNVHLKEGQIDWSEVKAAEDVSKLQAITAELSDAVAKLKTQQDETAEKVEDLIHIAMPEPADGMTNESRLEELEDAATQARWEVDRMRMTGEARNDGWSIDQYVEHRDRMVADLETERRRQKAVERLKARERAGG